MNKNIDLNQYHVGATLEPSHIIQVKNYNPIKGESFEIAHTPRNNNKYDYNPQRNFHHTPYQVQKSVKEPRGLDYESPISKYNKKNQHISAEPIES
jgi:hypothetical protein